MTSHRTVNTGFCYRGRGSRRSSVGWLLDVVTTKLHQSTFLIISIVIWINGSRGRILARVLTRSRTAALSSLGSFTSQASDSAPLSRQLPYRRFRLRPARSDNFARSRHRDLAANSSLYGLGLALAGAA